MNGGTFLEIKLKLSSARVSLSTMLCLGPDTSLVGFRILFPKRTSLVSAFPYHGAARQTNPEESKNLSQFFLVSFSDFFLYQFVLDHFRFFKLNLHIEKRRFS